MESLNPEYEGYNLDDFMRTMTSLAAWHKIGRPVGAPDAQEQEHAQNKERVRVMIDTGFGTAKAHQDQVLNDVEMERLALLAEREQLAA